MGTHFIPQVNLQTTKVRSHTARLSVSSIQLAASGKFTLQERFQSRRGSNHSENMSDALRVQVATESLKLRCEQYRVCSNDLLIRVPPSPPRCAAWHMRLRYLIERGCSGRLPLTVRS